LLNGPNFRKIVTLDERFEAALFGMVDQTDHLLCCKDSRDEQNCGGPVRGRLFYLTLGCYEILVKDWNTYGGGDRPEQTHMTAEVHRFSYHADARDGTPSHLRGKRYRITPAQKVAFLLRADLDLGDHRKPAFALPTPN
jgi:hypothetical protein